MYAKVSACLLIIFIGIKTSVTKAQNGVITSQTADSSLYITDGGVNACVIAGDTMYIGGGFKTLLPYSGYGIAIPVNDSNYDHGMPKVNGPVYAVITDGRGGWYIGGSFTEVGDYYRHGVAHIKSDKTVDPNWSPQIEPGYSGSFFSVKSLARSGDTVFVGGSFDNVAGTSNGTKTRKYLASFDGTGNITSWDPEPDGQVFSLAVSDTNLYVGGDFFSVDNRAASRANAAAFNISTGAVENWNPGISGRVNVIKVYKDTVYLGGSFGYSKNSVNRNYLASFDADSGAVTSWDPQLNNDVYAMAIDSNGTLYAGGAFDQAEGNYVYYFAEYNLLDGKYIGPGQSFDDWVYSIAVYGNIVFAGGVFTTVSGYTSRNHIAAFDTGNNNALTTWNPGTNDDVYALAISSTGKTIYAGGVFNSSGNAGITRNGLAAINLKTNKVTDWNPNPDSGPNSIAVSKDHKTVYIGGPFSSVNGSTSRSHLAAIDASSGKASAWNPDVNDNVGSLVVDDSMIIAGGWFTKVNGTVVRNYLAAFDTSKGNVETSWNPDPDQEVYSLEKYGNTLYAGGIFTTFNNSVNRNHIASINLADGSINAWNPNLTGAAVSTIKAGSNNLYIGGSFSSIGGTTRNNLAAFKLSDGSLTTWNPDVTGEVDALAVTQSAVYAGGSLGDTVGTTKRNWLIAYDKTNGTMLDWNPVPNNDVNTIQVSNGEVYIGGGFTDIGGNGYAYFAGIQAATSNTTPIEQPLVRKPELFKLRGNYPNPFNPTTTIRFQLSERADVTLQVFNILGRLVQTIHKGLMPAGTNDQIVFNAYDLSSGVYFYRIIAHGAIRRYRATSKFLLIK